MPSIPQSLLWISLVVLWLFVLVPMLVNKREAVRRTSDVALSTRVLTGAGRVRGRMRPAAGHHSDPDWQHAADDADEYLEEPDRESSYGDADDIPTDVFAAAADSGEQTAFNFGETESADGTVDSGFAADVGDDADEGDGAHGEEVVDGAEDDSEDSDDSGGFADSAVDEDAYEDAGRAEREAVDALAYPVEPGDGDYEYREPLTGAQRRANASAQTAAAVSARKYEFRKRALLALALVLVVATLVAFTVAPGAWWFSIASAAAMVLYLSYLRRQTRIEEQVRARRMERLARSRARAGLPPAMDLEVVPDRLRRPGVAVLEIDDEDPAFEHLEYASTAPDYTWRRDDLPRASGQ